MIHTIEQLHHAVHLGKDSFTLGRIQQSTIEECVNILKNYRRVMEEYGVTAPSQIRAVATSSVREASNRDTFLDRVYIATRINLEVIDRSRVPTWPFKRSASRISACRCPIRPATERCFTLKPP